MKNLLNKYDYTRPVFVSLDGKSLGYFIGKQGQNVQLPKKLTPGADYAVTESGDSMKATMLKDAPTAKAVGGFHVGLDGLIVVGSIWDTTYRPACLDPRGMVRVPGVGWVDIYLLNTNPQEHGTSAAGQEIADGVSKITMPNGDKESLTWFVASFVLEHHGKQLLSRSEFEIAMEGVTENLAREKEPSKTSHTACLRSNYGIEQATGCMWIWSRSVYKPSGPYMYVLGGGWDSIVAGPRRWYYDRPGDVWNVIAARGRCDHLIPDGSEAKA